MSDLIIEGAKGIPDGLYVIKDGELFKYKPNGGSVRSYHITDRPKGEWIPCSERLPEVGEICLLTVHEYGWNCKDYTRVIIGEYSDNYADHILAWMTLPTPYRERSEE